MDKLIRLLQQRTIECGWNEVRKLRWWRIYLTRKGRMYPHYDANAVIISKRFGFIRRLVERDLIDLDKLKDNTSFTMLTHSIWLWCEWHTAHEWESILRAIWTNAIIAYLSIQDEPIKFLISILK